MTTIYGDSLEEIYRDVLLELTRNPDHDVSPRGQRTKELLGATLVLSNPRARLIGSPRRKVNYAFAAAEFLWYAEGSNQLERLLPYNKRLAEFSNDGVTLNSAYGVRIFDSGQWNKVRKELIDDPSSRRAVIQIFRPSDLWDGNKDVPCTLSMQFHIRDGKLNLHVVMRSNDVIWGLPYDAFSFTLLQECMLLELREAAELRGTAMERLELGKYIHTAGSLHIYERHFEMAEDIYREWNEDNRIPDPMDPLQSLDTLNALSNFEKALRESGALACSFDPHTGERFMAMYLQHRWRGGFIDPLLPARPAVARFDDGRLIACEDSDP